MRFSSLLIILLILAPYLKVNASIECLGSAFALSLIRDIADIEGKGMEHVLENFCEHFPLEMNEICTSYIETYGGRIIEKFNEVDNPDIVAYELGLCKNLKCRLFPDTAKDLKYLSKNQNRIKVEKCTIDSFEKDSKLKDSIWEIIMSEIKKITKKHIPLVDLDGDHFVTYKTLRGSNWRGRDCNDLVANYRPGIVPPSGDIEMDSNCNGIYGRDENGVSYEDKFCKDSEPMGVLVIGDSVGAHFRVPPEYFNAQQLLDGALKESLIPLLEMEFDWPHKSYGTGHDTSYNKYCPGDVKSIYLEMRNINRCNHRNYQNLAVNGMESKKIKDLLSTTITKSQEQEDYPTLTILEIIGNDICHSESIEKFITNEQFKTNIIGFLDELDKTVAPGSKLMFIGMVRGSILYDSLHDNIHPFGHNTTYAEIYEYLKCQDLSPCPMWMTTNKTVRDAADAAGLRLDKVYKEIAHSYTPKNFEIGYIDFPLPDIIDYVKKRGEPVSDLIEPVDGFHPSQLGQYLIAEMIWKNINLKYPTFIPKVNPYNEEIEKIFNDQGGY
ncbi:acyloxyacyl hydrolase [Anaeramoeba flamelloides]|uniref:Acyloxyacyl hydrolase n=1 Tax=Anaeramoeba flamelloides TaxID=1746091 RepID=A0ABQ8Z6Z2_9EUKA|nr:acyloxyacyl hydrolase [Anaeramoeba flamelloides]